MLYDNKYDAIVKWDEEMRVSVVMGCDVLFATKLISINIILHTVHPNFFLYHLDNA